MPCAQAGAAPDNANRHASHAASMATEGSYPFDVSGLSRNACGNPGRVPATAAMVP